MYLPIRTLALVAFILVSTIAAPTISTNSTLITHSKRGPPLLQDPTPWSPSDAEFMCFNTSPKGSGILAEQAVREACLTWYDEKKYESYFKPGFQWQQLRASAMETAVDDMGGGFDADYYVHISVTVKPGCQWKFDYVQCFETLRRVVIHCNEDRTHINQGGIMETPCLAWRIYNDYEDWDEARAKIAQSSNLGGS